jgi:hypothetical protein
MKYKSFELLPPVTFRIFDKKLRKQVEHLSTDGCEFAAGPAMTHPAQPVASPAANKKGQQRRRRRGGQK